MSRPHTSLLKQRRFLPYFVTQFLGAFNDNVFKNALLLLVVFYYQDALPISSDLFINLAAGLFILPFFLFSASAGVLTDYYEKSAFIRWVKAAEVLIMLLAAYGFLTDKPVFLLFVLFLMGTQSAFFGPVKYALLPQHLDKTELMKANALVEGATFLAILLGTILAGSLTSLSQATHILAFCVLLFAVLGYLASRAIPLAPSNASTSSFRWQPIRHTRQVLAVSHRDSQQFIALLAISWFWFLGATYLTQFPRFTQLFLQANESAVSFLLALFSIGIACGSLACSRLTRQRVDLGLVTFASMGISLFGYLFVATIPDTLPVFTELNAFIFYADLRWTFSAIFLLGLSGGLFIVPLYVFIQLNAKPEERAQIIAGLNIYNALFMVLSALFAILCLTYLDWTITRLFLLLAALNTVVTLLWLVRYPIESLRVIVQFVLHLGYRFNVISPHRLPEQGGGLLVCNHVSYLDALFICAASPRLVRFVMEEDYTQLPLIRCILAKAKVIPISSQNPRSLRKAFGHIEQALAAGELVCIFPEGKLTSNGELAPFMRGMDIILRRSPVPVLPMALRGLWGSFFSRYSGKACRHRLKGFRTQVQLIIGDWVTPQEVTAQMMQGKVRELLTKETLQ